MPTQPKFITETEFEHLRKGARLTRYPTRNELIIVMLYRHGLRETELCNTRLEQMDLEQGRFHLQRLKGSNSFSHPIDGEELRLIRRYLRFKEDRKGQALPWLFVSDRGNQFCRSTIIKTVNTCAVNGGITEKAITPHMLRHGCGFYLANKGYDVRVIQDYLGHKNIQNTVIYTQLTGKQFEGMWD